MRRNFDPHHSEEEAVVNANYYGVKRKNVHPSAYASAPSNGNWNCHKRARHPDVESKASQAVARGSAAKGLTMPATDIL